MNIQELQNTIDELSKTKQRIQAIQSDSNLTDNEELTALHSDMRRLYSDIISNLDIFSVKYHTLKEKCLSKLQEEFPGEHFEFNHIVTDSSIIGCCSDPTIHLTYSITLHSATESIEFMLNTDSHLVEETEIPIANCLLFPFILSQLEFPETSSKFCQTIKKAFWEIIEENVNSRQIEKTELPELPFI